MQIYLRSHVQKILCERVWENFQKFVCGCVHEDFPVLIEAEKIYLVKNLKTRKISLIINQAK